jgi:hypothetical protein
VQSAGLASVRVKLLQVAVLAICFDFGVIYLVGGIKLAWAMWTAVQQQSLGSGRVKLLQVAVLAFRFGIVCSTPGRWHREVDSWVHKSLQHSSTLYSSLQLVE